MNGKIYYSKPLYIFLYNTDPSNLKMLTEIKQMFLKNPNYVFNLISDKHKFLQEIDVEILLKLI